MNSPSQSPADHACGECSYLANGGASCARLSFANVVVLLPHGFSCLLQPDDADCAEFGEFGGAA